MPGNDAPLYPQFPKPHSTDTGSSTTLPWEMWRSGLGPSGERVPVVWTASRRGQGVVEYRRALAPWDMSRKHPGVLGDSVRKKVLALCCG